MLPVRQASRVSVGRRRSTLDQAPRGCRRPGILRSSSIGTRARPEHCPTTPDRSTLYDGTRKEMNPQESLLELRFDGKAVGPGRIPVAHLLAFLASFDKVLKRVSRVLLGDSESVQRGRTPRSVEREVKLDLVSLREGSPAAVLGFERATMDPLFPEMDFGQEILERAVDGLRQVQEQDTKEALPVGYDHGVLKAWHDASKLFRKGISSVNFSLRGRNMLFITPFTLAGFRRIQMHMRGPEINIQTIEGRLVMADFKEVKRQFRIHPPVGEPIFCQFDEKQMNAVMTNIVKHIRVRGKALEDPTSGKLVRITVDSIESLEDGMNSDPAQLEPRTDSYTFWDSPSLEDLADEQCVEPVTDVEVLLGTWPGEKEDGFEAAIDELRHSQTGRSHQS